MVEGNPGSSASGPPAALLIPAGRTRPWRERVARRLVLDRVRGIERGRIDIVEDDQIQTFGNPDSDLAARVEIRDPTCWIAFAGGGTIGAAEAFCEGLWTTPDPTAVVRVFARNQEAMERLEGGAAHFAKPFRRLWHLLRSNTESGSRKNIAAHYDRGNSFFSRFLDPGMTYSCAVFPNDGASLEEAQQEKLDLVCRKLHLSPGDRLVEIGTGWGSLAIHAAGNYGCEVVTTTVSGEQFAYATELVRKQGLADRVTVLHEDYRALPRVAGSFDKLASIEMIEAVGHRYLPRYFQAISDLLAPGGLALIQAILMPDQRYEQYRRSVDFIQRHIFPGGLLPSFGRIQRAVAKTRDMGLLHFEDLTPHYARTLALWRSRFEAREDEIEALGLGAPERRKWRFYFAYCEGGFEERIITAAQLLFSRPGAPP